MKKVGLVLLVLFALLKGGMAQGSESWGGRGCGHSAAGPRPLHACFRPAQVWLIPLQ